jgi:hypothetical protein
VVVVGAQTGELNMDAQKSQSAVGFHDTEVKGNAEVVFGKYGGSVIRVNVALAVLIDGGTRNESWLCL